MPFWTNIYLSSPFTFISHFKLYQMCLLGQSMYSMLSRTKLHLNKLSNCCYQSISEKPSFYLLPSRPLPFRDLFCLHLLFAKFNYFHWFSLAVVWNYLNYVYHLVTQILSKLHWCEWLSFTNYSYVQLHSSNRVEVQFIVPCYIQGYQVKICFKGQIIL